MTQISRLVIYMVERCAELGVAVTPPHRQVVAAAVLNVGLVQAEAVLEPLYNWEQNWARCSPGVR
jgi:hypothetical protein